MLIMLFSVYNARSIYIPKAFGPYMLLIMLCNGLKISEYTVNDKSFTVRKLLRFSQIFIKPRKFSLLNFCSSEVQTCMKVVMEKIAKLFPAYLMNPANRETFHPRNFCRLWYEAYRLMKFPLINNWTHPKKKFW